MLATAGSARPMPENHGGERREQRHLRAGPLGPGLPRAGRVLPAGGAGAPAGAPAGGAGAPAGGAGGRPAGPSAGGGHAPGPPGAPGAPGPAGAAPAPGAAVADVLPGVVPAAALPTISPVATPPTISPATAARATVAPRPARPVVRPGDGLASPGGRTGRDLRRTRGRPRASRESVGCRRTSGSPSCQVRQPQVQQGHDRHLQGRCPVFRGVARTLGGNARIAAEDTGRIRGSLSYGSGTWERGRGRSMTARTDT